MADKREEIAICDINNTHLDAQKKALDKIPKDSSICDLSEFFKVFGDFTRLKILFALYDNELCVCDIASIVSSTPSAISHQLRVLKKERLVRYRKQGKEVYYTLDDSHVGEIISKGLEHIMERGGQLC